MDIIQEDKHIFLAAFISFGVGFILGLAIHRRIVQVEAQEAAEAVEDEIRERRQAERFIEKHQDKILERRQEKLIKSYQGRLIDRLDLEEERPMVPVKKSELPVTRPYRISEEEFLANEPDHEQTSVVYYEGNQTLLDEVDEVVEDIEFSVGVQNLARLEEDGDDDVVYIRNDAISLDYEVVREPGNYVELNAASNVDKHDSS